MSVVATTITLLGLLLRMAEQIATAVQRGDSDEEILERLRAPGGVAQDILDAVRERKTKLSYPGPGPGAGS